MLDRETIMKVLCSGFDNIVIYYKDGIEMNGTGITRITEADEEITLEELVEILHENSPSMDIFDTSFYFGADLGGYDLRIDYDTDIVSDKAIDIINDYIFYYPITFEKEK